MQKRCPLHLYSDLENGESPVVRDIGCMQVIRMLLIENAQKAIINSVQFGAESLLIFSRFENSS